MSRSCSAAHLWRAVWRDDGTREKLAALFAAAKGVEAFAVTDIVQRMWEKLVHLSTAAAMTCLMRANVGEIVRTPYGRELFLDQVPPSQLPMVTRPARAL